MSLVVLGVSVPSHTRPPYPPCVPSTPVSMMTHVRTGAPAMGPDSANVHLTTQGPSEY